MLAQEAGHVYQLEATLDPAAHAVDGSARIVWVNTSEVPVTELHFHLYMNAFESRDTVFMKESGGQLRGDRFDGSGRIVLSELRLEDGTDLLAAADRELVPHDHTQLRVPLPAPVPPGGSLALRTRFRTELPPVFARAGYHGSFHMVAQWFPKLAVLERDGRWASFPYHGMGEFYADFARYELTVRTPAAFTVAATGVLVSEEEAGGDLVRRYVAERVHDTAFAAWDHFVVTRRQAGPVEILAYAPPGYEAATERHLDVAAAGLSYFGRLYGEYPYPVLSIISPPQGASGAAGMEYPTLFCTAGPWFVIRGMPMLQEETTVHELGHMWFQGLVATNEVQWPMLDEGINTWAHNDLLRALHGRNRSALHTRSADVDSFEVIRLWGLRLGGEPPPPGRPAFAFDDDDYGRSVYGMTALVLETIARTWGRDRMHRALGQYARENRFRHPGPEALFRTFDAVYWPGFSRRVLRPALIDGLRAEVRLTTLQVEAGMTIVEGERVETLPVPTWVELHGADGRRSRVAWPAGEAHFRHVHPGVLVAARADPDRALLTDPSVIDDSLRTEDAPVPERGFFARLLFLTQGFLSRLGP